MAAPLILTLALNPEAKQFFNELRQRHFPPERNFLQAHLTLFHHLPPQEPQIAAAIETRCKTQPSFTLQVTGVASIGRGVAYKLDSPELQELHKDLQQQWHSWLTPQDKQRLWPHVTIQNKVAPHKARALLQELQDTFSPLAVQGTGLQLWEYLDGPWRLLQPFPFEG